jgi:phosphotransferase system enzyme I (PtsP)
MTVPVQKGKNAPDAVIAAGQKYIALFSASPDPYMREKVHDIEDLVTRLIRNLAGREAKLPPVRHRIVVATDLYPSDLLKLSSEEVKGIVLLSGGVTSHVSILARSLQIPMVIVNDPVTNNISDGDRILIDAEIGNVYINPGKDIVQEFKDRIDDQAAVKAPPAMKPFTETKDGVRIKLMANVNLLKDLELLRQLSCDGIGLYRSEFPFIIRKNFPTEEEQFFIYKKLVEGAPGKDVTFRTLDIGGDKTPAYWEPERRGNPFLGLRSIRFSLKYRDIFTQQIRAILRAGVESNLKIMFPLIFSLEEFLQAKGVVLECVAALKKSGGVFNDHPQIGMMVEVPAVIAIIEEFARIVDFFSIGTNDLVQYMLAVDRTNEEVAEYYIPHHPAVLRAIKRVADAAKTGGKEVSVCGDMANDARYLQFLIGCGIRKLSMNPIYLAENQKIIGEIDVAEAEALALRLLATGNIGSIENDLFSSYPG